MDRVTFWLNESPKMPADFMRSGWVRIAKDEDAVMLSPDELASLLVAVEHAREIFAAWVAPPRGEAGNDDE